MTAPPPSGTKPREIVVGFDFSELSERAVDEALAIVNRSAPAELHIVVAAEADGALVLLPGEAVARTEEAASEVVRLRVAKLIDDHQLRMGPTAVERVAIYVLTGANVAEPGRLITDLATSVDANLIVVGTHGRRGLARMLLGSVAQDVVKRASCSVLVVRPPDMVRGERVPTIEPPLLPGQPHVHAFHTRRTYHYVDNTAGWSSRGMPVS